MDETQYASFYGWMPLQDTTVKNGAVNIIPGSHLWGIDFRSLDIPWSLANDTNLLMEHSIPIEMKAGEILLFEGALIHGSYINQTKNVRAALNFFFKPKDAPLCHFMRDETTPTSKVEGYYIDMDFFYTQDIRQRPDSSIYPFSVYFDFDEKEMGKRGLMQLLDKRL